VVEAVPAGDRAAVARAVAGAELVVIAVPDGAIAATAGRVLAVAGEARPAVVHLSGALDAAELDVLAAAGFSTGSFHPFLPFSEERPPQAFRGATIGIEASADALEATLSALARALGARPRIVPSGRRTLYHAAGMMASAYVVALAADAAELLEHAGFERRDALQTLLPLMAATLENLAADGLPGALSGPLRRGDAATVARPTSRRSGTSRRASRPYRVLGEAAVELARGTGLPAEQVERIRALLRG
jgi:predicted short-subunit dehydrogenase-like oxidoreductase (DUF2520 family)